MPQYPALKYLEEHYERFQNELIELLRIPSISHDPAYQADMDQTAGWLADKLRFQRSGGGIGAVLMFKRTLGSIRFLSPLGNGKRKRMSPQTCADPQVFFLRPAWN